jgi:hypothetical protein
MVDVTLSSHPWIKDSSMATRLPEISGWLPQLAVTQSTTARKAMPVEDSSVPPIHLSMARRTALRPLAFLFSFSVFQHPE